MLIYCDNNASTALRAEAFEAMLPFLRDEIGNPSSVHRLGSTARCAIEDARCDVAALIGATAAEIVFTSGGTESNNLAIVGLAGALLGQSAENDRAVATTAIEHSSVRAPIDHLLRTGWQKQDIPLGPTGRIDTDSMVASDRPAARFASVAWANNEIGTLQPIDQIGRRCRELGILLHSDAVQAAGKVPLSCELVDLMSLSAHKLGGPKGVGALYIRRGTEIEPLLRGGGQERERRAGTENVAGIVGFGVACRLAATELTTYAKRTSQWREALWDQLQEHIADCRRNSPEGPDCLPNTLHLSFAGVRGEALVAALDIDGLAVSAGSACAAGAGEPSHVLLALGHSEDEARNGVRFSCGRESKMKEISLIVDRVVRAVDRIRAAHPISS